MWEVVVMVVMVRVMVMVVMVTVCVWEVMVVVVNPNNPAGVVVARDRLEEISSICEEANVILVW